MTQCLFPTFSELQLWEDGVDALTRRLDVVDGAATVSRRCRSTQVGGVAGQGGGADIVECQAGKNGAVKIMKPGFYSEDASLLQARGQV